MLYSANTVCISTALLMNMFYSTKSYNNLSIYLLYMNVYRFNLRA